MRAVAAARGPLLAYPPLVRALPAVPPEGLLLGIVVAVAALVVATMEIGSGDYGQWLMAARPYAGLDVPGYRADSGVPPLVPAVLGTLQLLIGDPLLALRLLLVALVTGLGAGAALAGAAFFRSPLTGLVAAAGCLLFSDRFVDLFAFGGLLQVAGLIFLLLAVGAFQRAPDEPAEWRWWIAGAVMTGLGALSHIGTASILVTAAAAVAGLNMLRLALPWRQRLLRLVPLGVVLLATGGYWLVVLLPGAADLGSNPASLHYRGPDRLADSLLGHAPSAAIMSLGAVGLLAGVAAELRQRRIGPWLALLAWTAVSVAVVTAAVAGGVATDYPRFATPLLAPLVVAAAGAGVWALGQVARRAATRWPIAGQRPLALYVAVAVIALAAPAAMSGFRGDVAGYRLADSHGLRLAAQWIDEHVPADAAVLAPVREAKWIEGLTGRAALFSNPVRYSFRPAEWQRSLAAETLFKGSIALVSEFFFLRFADADATTRSPRQLSIAANHGGEFVELLNSVPSSTLVLGQGGSVLASLANLPAADRRETSTADEIALAMSWRTLRQGQPVEYRQTAVLLRDSSTLELRAGIDTPLPAEGFQFDLKPALPLVATTAVGDTIELTFASAGASAPRLRLLVARGNASITALPNGAGVRVAVRDDQVRLLITDLTAASSPSIGLQTLAPGELVDRYAVGAALIRLDPSYGARRDRLEVLGFRLAGTFGSYALMVRE